jgi:hypothetical protein
MQGDMHSEITPEKYAEVSFAARSIIEARRYEPFERNQNCSLEGVPRFEYIHPEIGVFRTFQLFESSLQPF